MLIKGEPNTGEIGRTVFPLEGFEVQVTHFVVRETSSSNPFKPHKHEQPELWYISAGEGFFFRDGEEEAVQAGDLIAIEPWLEHGIRTEIHVTWICMG